MKKLIEKLDNFGAGITFIDDKITFVPYVLPGEEVEVAIDKTLSKYNEGTVKEIYKKSEDRVEAKCPFYTKCGGCDLQHVSFDLENKIKSDSVKDIVKRIGHVYPDLVKDTYHESEYGYRNKVTFHIKNRELGLYRSKSNDLVLPDKCLLLRNEINSIISILRDIVKNNKNNISEVMVRCSNYNSDLMVSFKGELVEYNELKSKVKCIYSNNELVYGEELITEIGDYKFYASPKSFFQVNSEVVDKLYNEVLNYCIDNKPSNVLDLYCGTGTIGLYISKEVDHVLGIDCSKSSIDDANKNMILNDTNNVEFVCSKVEDYIDKITGNYDLIVVDPPRAGLDKKTIEYLKKFDSKTIIYISCFPTTLARDIDLLSDKYEVKSIKPFNMFPRTSHVESVVLLERR